MAFVRSLLRSVLPGSISGALTPDPWQQRVESFRLALTAGLSEADASSLEGYSMLELWESDDAVYRLRDVDGFWYPGSRLSTRDRVLLQGLFLP